MMASWMVYTVAVTAFFAAAAWALERALRSRAFSIRWGWIAAMVGSATVSLATLFREARPTTALATREPLPVAGGAEPLSEGLTPIFTTPALPPDLDPWVLGGWVILSLGLAAMILRAVRSFVRVRASWTPTRVDGRDVLVSEGFGPATVGLVRPVIVLPRWVLSADTADRELMIRHEEEHMAARDAHLLSAGLLLALVFPWNLPLWWQGWRLRFAVEIDCDRRVLRRTADLRRYADLLVDMASRGWSPRIRALALARPVPFLERRIRAMTDPASPRVIRTLLFAALSALLVFAACEMERPSPTAPLSPDRVETEVTAGDPGDSSLRIEGLEVSSWRRGGWHSLTGTLMNRDTDEPVSAVQITIRALEIGTLSNTQGRFLLLNIPDGDHTVLFQHPELGETTARVVISGPPAGEVDAAEAAPSRAPTVLQPRVQATDRAETGAVVGTITESGTGAAVQGAQFFIPALEIGAIANIHGRTLLLNVPPGTHILRIEAEGFVAEEREIVVTAGETTRVEVELRR